jgi:S1-C subfamily serine protease
VLVPRLVAIVPAGPAATAGFAEGDVVAAVDGAAVDTLSPQGVRLLIINRAPGTHVRIAVTRGGKSITADVVLANAR